MSVIWQGALILAVRLGTYLKFFVNLRFIYNHYSQAVGTSIISNLGCIHHVAAIRDDMILKKFSYEWFIVLIRCEKWEKKKES